MQNYYLVSKYHTDGTLTTNSFRSIEKTRAHITEALKDKGCGYITFSRHDPWNHGACWATEANGETVIKTTGRGLQKEIFNH